jgi:hypothetical protein
MHIMLRDEEHHPLHIQQKNKATTVFFKHEIKIEKRTQSHG